MIQQEIIKRAKNNKNEFIDFIKQYNVISLAIGVVLGGATKDLVNSIANDMIMPIVGIFSPDGSWRSIVLTISGAEFKIGNLLGSLLNFLIISLIIFLVIHKIFRIKDIETKK